MKKQLFMLAFAMAAMTASAQTVIFDGESGSRDPWWDDASATIADNPTKEGINISDKCLQITANNGQKCAKLGMGGTSLNGMRRISFMIKMSESGVNVKVKLIKDGAYYLSRAVWYDGNGAWQKKTVLFPETSVVDANTCIELFPHENESYGDNLVAYIDNVQLEGAIVGGAGIDGMADNTISAEAKITGIRPIPGIFTCRCFIFGEVRLPVAGPHAGLYPRSHQWRSSVAGHPCGLRRSG